MRSEFIRSTLFAAGMLLAATPAAGQLGAVEGLFKEVEAVTVFLQHGRVADSENATGDDLFGAGTEVLINVASPGLVDVEFGLGASFLRGYGAVEPSLDLRTSIRAIPTVTVYLSPQAALGPLSGYVGMSLGLVELWNAQAYEADGTPWNLAGATFEYGASAGAYLQVADGFALFAEAGYRNRRFGSLRWDGDGALPAGWPRSLDLSGSYLQYGVQLRVEEPDKAAAEIVAPAPAGVWTLERVDGNELPAALDAPDPRANRVVHGVLRLHPDTAEGPRAQTGRYTLELHLRPGTAGGDAQPAQREIGSYSAAGNALTFTPAASGRADRAERLAGRLYLTWDRHVLVFAPGAEPED